MQCDASEDTWPHPASLLAQPNWSFPPEEVSESPLLALITSHCVLITSPCPYSFCPVAPQTQTAVVNPSVCFRLCLSNSCIDPVDRQRRPNRLERTVCPLSPGLSCFLQQQQPWPGSVSIYLSGKADPQLCLWGCQRFSCGDIRQYQAPAASLCF